MSGATAGDFVVVWDFGGGPIRGGRIMTFADGDLLAAASNEHYADGKHWTEPATDDDRARAASKVDASETQHGWHSARCDAANVGFTAADVDGELRRVSLFGGTATEPPEGCAWGDEAYVGEFPHTSDILRSDAPAERAIDFHARHKALKAKAAR